VSKNVIKRIDKNLARRLREARRESGFSVREVSKRLPRRLAVSHATIASYENGVSVPPVDILAGLADVYRRPLNWFLENREFLTDFRYRNLHSRVALGDQRQFEGLAAKWAEAYAKLDRHLNQRPPHACKPLPGLESISEVSPERVAQAIRTVHLNLDDKQPICNAVTVLESFLARALELRATFSVDGAAANLGGDYFVVLNPEVANVRVRMNAASELAYVLFKMYGDVITKSVRDVEKFAYSFGTSLLLPDSQLRDAFDGRSFLKLIQFKEKFGVSLAAMIYRAQTMRIINSTVARWLWSQMSQRGWRENEPGYVWRDRAITFEILLESATQTKRLSWSDAERVTGVREEDLKQRIDEIISGKKPHEEEEESVALRFEAAANSA
jgi:transcriptional regulator with XRE-family HTH domain/Zn-dependent peptidase ImmA (M78 family)